MNVYSHSEPGNHEVNEGAIGVARYAADLDKLIGALAYGQGGRRAALALYGPGLGK